MVLAGFGWFHVSVTTIMRNYEDIIPTSAKPQKSARGFTLLLADEMTRSGQNRKNFKYKRKWLKIKRTHRGKYFYCLNENRSKPTSVKICMPTF